MTVEQRAVQASADVPCVITSQQHSMAAWQLLCALQEQQVLGNH
jgi:hypothetical protein